MRIHFTSTGAKETEPVLSAVCNSLQKEFEELLKDVEISQALDEIAVIVTAVEDEPEHNQCRCMTPVSVSSNENYVTGDKATIMTIRPSIQPTFVLRNSAEAIRKRVLSELIDVISNIKMKRILVMIDQSRFVELVRSRVN